MDDGTGRYTGLGGLRGSALGDGNVEGRLGLMHALRPLRGDRLLDVGCGDGTYTTRMAGHFTAAVGIDVEPDRLEVFGGAPAAVALRASATAVPFEGATFDAVTMIETLEHLGDGLEPALAEAARVLRPDGTLYVTTPNRWWPLEQHGFELRGRRHPGWHLPFLTWVPPLHRRLSPDDAFTPRRVDRLVEPHGFRRSGLAYMFPPLDRRPRLRRVSRGLWRRLLATPARRFAQTLVLTYDRVPHALTPATAPARAAWW